MDRYYHALTLTDSRVIEHRAGARARGRDPLAEAGRGLLPRRPPGLDVHSQGAAVLPGPAGARPRPARGLRRPLPHDLGPGRAGRPADRGVGPPDGGRRALGAPVAAAARLQVRRPLRRPARHLPVVAHAPLGRHPGQGRPRGDGVDPRRPPAPRGRTRGGDPRARGRGAPEHAGPSRALGRRPGAGRGARHRLPRPRLGGHHPAAPAHAQPALRGARGGPAARPQPLPRRGVPGGARAPQREPVLRAQHHRPLHPPHQRRGDHARGGPRARGRAPDLRAALRAPGVGGPRPAHGRDQARVPRRGDAGCSRSSARAT